MLWGGWLLVTAVTFSFMAGIFHAYYTVALAPAVAALVGIGAWLLWQHRSSLRRLGRGQRGGVADDRAELLPARPRPPTSCRGCAGWCCSPASSSRWLVAGLGRLPRRLAGGLAAAALVVVAGRPGGVRRRDRGHAAHRLDPQRRSGDHRRVRRDAPGTPPTTQRQGGAPTGGAPTGGGAGGLLNGSESTDTITALLQDDADQYTWVAAAVGSNSASGYQLASEEPVMAIGGFNGSDPSPTLAQFQAYVAAGEIHYFIAGGGFGGGMGGNQMGGSSASSEIAAWVAANFTATTVDGVTLYDLSAATTTGTNA